MFNIQIAFVLFIQIVMKEARKEYEYRGFMVNGFVILGVVFLLIPALIATTLITWMDTNPEIAGIVSSLLVICFALGCAGYFVQEPNESRVMIFFGKYRGTCRKTGFFWTNPFISRRKISLRISNMDIEPIKVNDKIGNPVLIGMVLVWKIRDTYRAVFDIDSQSLGANGAKTVSYGALENFVRIQSDAALREVTGEFAYDDDSIHPEGLTLRSGGDSISSLLEDKINERLHMAGMEVVEARLNYLAYAPEIAAVMLRRQQASAIIAARSKIVEGAVSMVHLALSELENEKVVNFSDSEKSRLVSNLLVVLCADEPAQPIISTGSGS